MSLWCVCGGHSCPNQLEFQTLFLICNFVDSGSYTETLMYSNHTFSLHQASRYIQNVLKPQQEMKLKKLEERFYQMTGETWKLSTGHRLEVRALCLCTWNPVVGFLLGVCVMPSVCVRACPCRHSRVSVQRLPVFSFVDCVSH